MSMVLGPDDFECLDGGVTPILGRGILQMMGFDPRSCEIKVEDNGNLSITQEGHYFSMNIARNFWRRAENIPSVCQNSSCGKVTAIPLAERDEASCCPSCGSIVRVLQNDN